MNEEHIVLPEQMKCEACSHVLVDHFDVIDGEHISVPCINLDSPDVLGFQCFCPAFVFNNLNYIEAAAMKKGLV